MAARITRQSCEITCNKCGLNTKSFVSCASCEKSYHIECVIQIKGMFIDNKQNIICCKHITSECTGCKQKDNEIAELKSRLFIVNEKILERSLAIDSIEYSEENEENNTDAKENQDKENFETLTIKVNEWNHVLCNRMTEIEVTLQEIKTHIYKTNQTNNNTQKSKKNTNVIEAETSTKENQNSELLKQSRIKETDNLRTISTRARVTKLPTQESKAKTTTEKMQSNDEAEAEIKTNNYNGRKSENTKAPKKIVGNSNEKVAFTKTERKWIYADRFKISYTVEELKEFLNKKFKTDNITIEMFAKKDYYTKEDYIGFKLGFPNTIDDENIFDASKWPTNISVRFFRRPMQKPDFGNRRNRYLRSTKNRENNYRNNKH